MQSISTALSQLHERGSWFARARELRLLVVRCSDDLRKPGLRILTGLEFHADNRSPWILMEDAHTASDSGWTVRTHRVLAHWERLREAFRKDACGELPPAESQLGRAEPTGSREPISVFQAAASGVLAALRPPLEGLVFVLAPAVVEDLERLSADLSKLLAHESLTACRWVLMLGQDSDARTLLKFVGDRGLLCDCVPDPEQQSKDFAAIASGIPGRARPRGVEPPRRVDDPPPPDPVEHERTLRASGVSPEYLKQAPELTRLLFGAALAMKAAEVDRALDLQRQAVALATRLELHDLRVICQIALASYLSGADERGAAIVELRDAIDVAARRRLALQEAQGRLALGLVLALEERFKDAIGEYSECARRAHAGGVDLIAIEAWRLAGQISLQTRDEAQAVACFGEALRVAEGGELNTVRSSSAAEAARALAVLYRRRGMTSQAESLFLHADAMEQGLVGQRTPEAGPSGD